jgi:hypothetical protein
LVILCGETIISQEEFNIEKVMEKAKGTTTNRNNSDGDLILDKAKIYIYESSFNNFINGVTLKDNDEHFILKPNNTNVFCISTKDTNTIRVIDSNLEKIHTLEPKGFFHFDISSFLVYQSVKEDEFYDNVLFEFLNVEDGKIIEFKNENEKNLISIYPIILNKKLDSIVGMTTSSVKKSGNGKLFKLKYNQEINQFQQEWTRDLEWKTNFIILNPNKFRLYNDQDSIYLLREYEDNRRFLSKESRLDLELKCFSLATGDESWKCQHECSFDSDVEECEKEFHLSIKPDIQQVLLGSFVYDGFDGASCLNCFHSTSGSTIFSYSNTRRGGLQLDGKFNVNFTPSLSLNVPLKYIRSEERRSLDMKDLENDSTLETSPRQARLQVTYSVRQQDTSMSSSQQGISSSSKKPFNSSFMNTPNNHKQSKDKKDCVMM